MSPEGGDERSGRVAGGRHDRDAPDEPAAPWDFAHDPASGARERPWWASGNGSEGGDAGSRDERFASGGAPGDASGEASGRRPGPGSSPHGGPHSRAGHDTCQVCPVCSLLRTLDDVRPEVVEHLNEAARHVTLAAKAFVDAQAARHARPDPRGFERIDLDD